MSHEYEDDEAQWQCQHCDYVGPPEEHENPPHLWGVIGGFSLQCPACGEFEDPLA